MTFAQVQADAEVHLAAIRSAESVGREHIEKTAQLVAVLASELSVRETEGSGVKRTAASPRQPRKPRHPRGE